MENKENNKRKEQYIENRKKLIALSRQIRELVKLGAVDSVNEGIINQYREENPEIAEFRTFWQWKADGYIVRKGEKAFLVWGKPRKVEQVPDGAKEPEGFKFWAICYLFADTQVCKPEQAQQAQKEPQPQE